MSADPGALLVVVLTVSLLGRGYAAEPNPPVWPASVKVFGPEDTTAAIESAVNAAFAKNGGHEPSNNGQFSSDRFAFFFKPGQYNASVPVGFYTQVSGLGVLPTDVVFNSEKGVYSEEGSFSIDGGALCSFWRIAENFQTNARHKWATGTGMIWAVSQAAPLRRIVVTGDLALYQYTSGLLAGYASGGFLANSQVKGKVNSGSQQQFMTRNSEVGPWSNGVWNIVFVGTKGAPGDHCSNNGGQPYVTVDATPVIAEKPFITVDKADKFYLNIPSVQKNHAGTDFGIPSTQVSFSEVFVASASKDTAETINAKLRQGLHVVLSPGIYNLKSPLVVAKANQVLLGLGMATLVSVNGNAVVSVGDVDGVRIGGLLLEAGSKPTKVLLEWGTDGAGYAGNAGNPGFLHDIFARVGGPAQPVNPQAKVMIKIHSGHVIGDNFWLWRADHYTGGATPPHGPASCPCENGLVVNGNDVTMYGLAVEHTQQDLVQWNGERGATYFFQSELPYHVNQSFGDNGYVGYRVNAAVKEHVGYGIGVYHFFADNVVNVTSGISCPAHLESSFHSPLAVFLSGHGRIEHILNDKGEATFGNKQHPGGFPSWICDNTAEVESPTQVVVV